MHPLRGLIRPASQKALQLLERTTDVRKGGELVVKAMITDIYGKAGPVGILHVASLLRNLEYMAPKDALKRVRSLKNKLTIPLKTTNNFNDTHTDVPTLYVRRTLTSVQEELRERQLRILAKLEGRFLTQDPAELNRIIKKLLQSAEEDPRRGFSHTDIALFRGIVEALAARDPSAALALAVNTKLPPLNAAAGRALAQLVDFTSPRAVEAFLEGFAPRDAALPAYETCSTQLALRLRRQLTKDKERKRKDEGEAGKGENGKDPQAARSELFAKFDRFHMDAAVVFLEDAEAIQRWASAQVERSHNDNRIQMMPWERAELMKEIIQRRQLRPMRAAMDSLSAWSLSDLHLSWLRAVLEEDHIPQPLLANHSEKSTLEEEEGKSEEKEAEKVDPVRAASYHDARSLAMKDLRRYLIQNRLLRQYAKLLKDGEITANHESFPSFLEECGDCHDCADCPEFVEFVMASPKAKKGASVGLFEALKCLAPQCSFWVALLEHFPERIRVFTAPYGDLRVQVEMPRVHECVLAASKKNSGSSEFPNIPILYEDDELLVVDKPAGLSTSRHALSCTAAGGSKNTAMEPVMDVLSLLLQRPQGEGLLNVFRQGQVHRLDTETSGCLLFAKTSIATSSLRHQLGTSAAFSEHNKLYLALCVVVEPELTRLLLKGELRDRADPKIRTRYRIVNFFASTRLALVECRIQQGKKHQIRRHLASTGMPIVGDLVHGGAVCIHPFIRRVALHSRSISFVHPKTAEKFCVSAPLPDDFQRALQILNG